MNNHEATPEIEIHASQALQREREREAALRHNHPIVWWGTLLTPFLVSILVLGLMWIFRSWQSMVGLAGTALTSLFFGKFIILAGTNGSQILLTPEELVVMVVYMDFMAALWFLFHFGFMVRIPLLGPKFALVIEDGEYVMTAYPWIRRAAFIGMILFVAIPFSMTGSVGGSILARLLGMTRRSALLAVVLGSILGALVMYLGDATISKFTKKDDPIWTIGGFVVLAGLILLLNYRYAKAKKRMRNPSQVGQSPESSKS